LHDRPAPAPAAAGATGHRRARQVHYFAGLQSAVEAAVARAGGVPATLVCHSMGTVVTHFFLTNATTAAWRAAHVAGFFAMGPVLGGAETALSRARPRLPDARAPSARCSASRSVCSERGGAGRALSRSALARTGAGSRRCRPVCLLATPWTLLDRRSHMP